MELLNIGMSIAGLIIVNYGIKFGRALPSIKKAFTLIKNQEEARKNGVLTIKEKVILYDDIEGLIKEIYSIIKGFFPNKSK